MDENTPKRPHLAPKQAKFVCAIMAGSTIESAGALCGLSSSAAKRMRRHPAVEAEIDCEINETIISTRTQLLARVTMAISVLENVAADSGNPPHVRRSAATDLISLGIRASESNDRRDISLLREILKDILERERQ